MRIDCAALERAVPGDLLLVQTVALLAGRGFARRRRQMNTSTSAHSSRVSSNSQAHGALVHRRNALYEGPTKRAPRVDISGAKAGSAGSVLSLRSPLLVHVLLLRSGTC